VPKFCTHIEEILSRARGNFEEQNTVLEPSIISNYCIIIIINAYYNYCIINASYNYYISHEFLPEECDQEENVEVTGAATTSCLKRRL